jgi:vancomycin resistance protein VanJ
MLTVMTHNLADGLALSDRLLPWLHRCEADVIGLQELAATQAAAIAEGLRDHYPYQSLHPLGIPGKGLLSRFPLRDSALLELHPGRPDLRVVVATPDGDTTIVVAHPPPPRFGRGSRAANAAAAEQFARLAEEATAGGPTVVLGDFNRVSWQAAYRRLAAAGLIDAFAVAGRGYGATSPTRLVRWGNGANPLGRLALVPMLRIDYVWTTHHFRPLAAWLGEPAGSDHRPVLARLGRSDLPPG